MRTARGIQRNSQSTFDAPASFQSRVEHVGAQVKVITPLCHRLRFAKSGKKTIVAPIDALFSIGRPSNITRFIIAVYVDSIQRIFRRWAASHFCQEFFKRLKTEFNATFAVVFIHWVVSIVTAAFGSRVNGQFGGAFTSADRFAVNDVHCADSIKEKAPTRTSVTRPQMILANGCSVAARTQTMPHSLRPFSDTRKSDDKQSVKTPPRQNVQTRINFRRIGIYGKIIGRHMFLLYRNVCLGWADCFRNLSNRSNYNTV